MTEPLPADGRVPALEPRCGSWIGTRRDGAVAETFDVRRAWQWIQAGWKVETASQYLGRLNREIAHG